MNDVELMLETLSHDLLVTDSPRAAQLVSAAAYGDSALEDALDGVQVERPHQGPPRSADLRGPLFLRRLEVGGFRGIGSGIALEFFPGPGLTVLFGANGSGKSSLLEALELAATGKLRRVEGRTAVWKQAMGNLHHPGPVTVAAEFLDLPASRASRVQIRATSPGDPMKSLDIEYEADVAGAQVSWARSMVTYRPFLAGDEIQRALTGRPGDLHDSIFQILGLGALIPVRERLTSARKQREATIKALQAERERLEALAAEWDDPRGRQVSYLLADPAPNADSLGAAIGQPDSPVMVVAGLVDLDLPTSAEVEAMAVRLDAASAQCELAERSMAQVRGGAGDALLALALSRMESTGDLSCPVCHQTQLGVSWMREAREQIAALADAQAEHAAATEELERARSDAWWMLQRGPSPEAPVDPEARELLYAWRAPGPSSTAPDLAVHLRVQHPRLRTVLEVESARAKAALEPQAAVPAQLKPRVEAWLAAYRSMPLTQGQIRSLHVAEKWVAKYLDDQRDRILIPYTQQCHQIWAELGQGRGVVLGKVELKGSSGTLRKLSLRANLGTVRADAQSVMSQGELFSLALALFIPRATSAASPFGFVVLDDPIQALDSEHVQGLARVLQRTARGRQVIVSTQDERLLAALKDSNAEMELITVTRGPTSTVLFQKDRGQPARSPATADPAESETAIEVDLADLADPKYYLLPHLTGLEHPGSAPALNGERPPHAGQPWTRDEDERLALRHLAGIPVKDLAVEFRRTRGAIRSRLIRLGLIAPG